MRQVYTCEGHGEEAFIPADSAKEAAIDYIGIYLRKELEKNVSCFEINVTDESETKTTPIIVSLSEGAEVSECDVKISGNVFYHNENHKRIAEMQRQIDKLLDAVNALHKKIEEINTKNTMTIFDHYFILDAVNGLHKKIEEINTKNTMTIFDHYFIVAIKKALKDGYKIDEKMLSCAELDAELMVKARNDYITKENKEYESLWANANLNGVKNATV